MPDDLTAALEGYRKIISDATPGPWELHSHGTPRQFDIWYDEFDTPLACDVFRESDGLFITAARSAMPGLLAALRAVLELGDRSGETQYSHLPGHVDVRMIREVISREITRKGETP